MIDTGSLIAILTASGALVVSILTHIKHSECYGFKVDTVDTTSPQAIDKNISSV